MTQGKNRPTATCGYSWERREVPTVMSTAERVDITLGCLFVRKSSGLQVLRSQNGACASVVVTGGDNDMMACHQSITWWSCQWE